MHNYLLIGLTLMAMMQASVLALSTQSKLEASAAMARHLADSAFDLVHHRTLSTGAANTVPADSDSHASATRAKVTRSRDHFRRRGRLRLPSSARTRSAFMLSGVVSRSAEQRSRRRATIFISDGANSPPLTKKKRKEKSLLWFPNRRVHAPVEAFEVAVEIHRLQGIVSTVHEETPQRGMKRSNKALLRWCWVEPARKWINQ